MSGLDFRQAQLGFSLDGFVAQVIAQQQPGVCTENLIRVADVMELPKLAE